jgi:hypothetical protein
MFRNIASTFWVCCVAAGTLAFPAAAGAQALGLDHDAMLKVQREQREMQYKRMQTMVTSFPTLGARDIQEIMQLKMDGNALMLSTPLTDPKHDMGGFRVACDPFKGPTFVSVSQIGVQLAIGAAGRAAGKAPAAANPPAPRIFCFSSYELPNPDELITFQIQSYGDRLQIDRSSRTGAGGFRRVMLVQQRSASPGAAAQGPAPVQLSVNEFGDNVPGGVPRNFSIQSADFQTLLREHGHEVEQYVRPLFRQLGQESALAPDGRVAWQVLADHWQPDPELAKKVRDLLPTLNDGDFHARDNALAQLESMGMQGAAVLLHMDRLGLSPEQNLLIDRTLAPFAQLSPRDATRLRSDTDFLMDCLYVANPDVRAAALDRLKQVTGKELSFDLNAPEAARPAAISELRRQLADKPDESPPTDPAKS